MLHQCGHQTNTAHPCPCGFQCGAGGYGGAAAASTFSFLFPTMSTGKQYMDDVFDSGYNYGASSSSVDCTLSLGTPSTRQSEQKSSSRSSCVSSLCSWDVLSRSKKSHPSVASTAASAVGCGASSGTSSLGGDPHLLARRCANCDTTSTPLWRNGPRGPKSLCNACGIRYKKEERRAAASAALPSSSASTLSGVASDHGIGIGFGYHRQQPTPWGCYSSPAAAVMRNGNDAAADDGDASYLSWRLNVVPSPHFSVGYN